VFFEIYREVCEGVGSVRGGLCAYKERHEFVVHRVHQERREREARSYRLREAVEEHQRVVRGSLEGS
jgi:hypothetical protein